MRTRQRHRSQEITFRAKVQEAIQLYTGGTGTAAVLNNRPATAAMHCLGSQRPLPARFLELPQPEAG